MKKMLVLTVAAFILSIAFARCAKQTAETPNTGDKTVIVSDEPAESSKAETSSSLLAGKESESSDSNNKLEQSSWLGALDDRSRGYQRELQVYAAGWRGPWQAQMQVVSGNVQRQMQRNLLLGNLQDAVATQLSGNYQAAYVELGRNFSTHDLTLTPYLGAQYVRLSNAGFDEGGSSGFGLRANAWDASRWQAIAGLRAARSWRTGDVQWRADARAEWQQTLATRGMVFDASYVGLNQWAPLQGMPLALSGQQFGVGVSALFGQNAMLRFDLSQRGSTLGASQMASLWASYRY